MNSAGAFYGCSRFLYPAVYASLTGKLFWKMLVSFCSQGRTKFRSILIQVFP